MSSEVVLDPEAHSEIIWRSPEKNLIRSKKARVVRTVPVESWRYGYDASPEGRKLQL